MLLLDLEESKKAIKSSVEDLLEGLFLHSSDRAQFILEVEKINKLIDEYYYLDRAQCKKEATTAISDSGETISDLRCYIEELKLKLYVFRKLLSLSKSNKAFLDNGIISHESVVKSIGSYETSILELENKLIFFMNKY